jgi:hypothetical protein
MKPFEFSDCIIKVEIIPHAAGTLYTITMPMVTKKYESSIEMQEIGMNTGQRVEGL